MNDKYMKKKPKNNYDKVKYQLFSFVSSKEVHLAICLKVTSMNKKENNWAQIFWPNSFQVGFVKRILELSLLSDPFSVELEANLMTFSTALQQTEEHMHART